MRDYRMTLARREWADANQDAVTVDFDSNEQFSFVPGQYVRIRLSDQIYRDEHGNARIFNVASSPSQTNSISIVTRLRDSAFKRNLIDLPIGTSVLVSQALGGFTLHAETDIGIVLLVGGTGIAPVIAMLHDLNERQASYNLSLFYSNQTIGRTVYRHELEAWQTTGVLTRYVKTFTRTDFTPHGCLLGRINEQMVEQILSGEEIASSHFYISGPWGMGDSMTEVLKNLHVPVEHIHVKEFDLKWLDQ
jgi:ferredoxin-NADP reductase